MDANLLAVVALILVALIFDYINGFHDAANSIATVVSTRVLTPGKAVIWAAFFNFIAAFAFGTGAAIAKAGFSAIIPAGWTKTLIFIILAPMIGMTLGFLLMVLILWVFHRTSPGKVDHWFRRLQLVSAAAYSLGHGGNDAQKTMGIIAGVLYAGGVIAPICNATWVILDAPAPAALGTLSGGWRIIHTMGSKITKLVPVGGFAAETAGAISLFLATNLGIPVSTTHTITGAIIGVGSIRRLSAVRWGVAGRIVWAWVLTIPAAAFISAITYFIVAYTIAP